MNNADALFAGYHSRILGNHLASEEAKDRKCEAIDAIESEIAGDLETFGEWGEDGIRITMADVWFSAIESLNEANDPNKPEPVKSLQDARDRFDAAIKAEIAEYAEIYAPKVYAGRVRRWGTP